MAEPMNRRGTLAFLLALLLIATAAADELSPFR